MKHNYNDYITPLGVTALIFLICVLAFMGIMYYGPKIITSEYVQILGGIVAVTGALLWALYQYHIHNYNQDITNISTRVDLLEEGTKELATKQDLDRALKPIHDILVELVRMGK